MLFSAGSARVVAFKFLQEINILRRNIYATTFTNYNLINFTISIISTTSAIEKVEMAETCEVTLLTIFPKSVLDHYYYYCACAEK